MYILSIETMISAAHRLREYDGNCVRIHGHNWKIRVEVKTDTLNELGMGIDFKELTDLSWQVVGRFDHQEINSIPPFDTMNPTAENLARYFYQEIGKLLPPPIRMHKISLWETDKYMVEYSE
ncbi:MAG TPA: 6-carboxytetrahydropterin synthase QueD [Caldithrix abyssi]|uniref:6-carboxy-5,6,7,8-tetrahydropterin synthase n=1 Tax=Caldithrix abyssi TaxID=187145 RepID=A0A7V4UF32_CALAY|nr:6-carboxytetrahydropterin synthase QueD [Caldithrix abyssi]